ncbi:hypothetical protein ACLB2K_052446 [Fragaria x ananassa]
MANQYWADLPVDVFSQVADRLSYIDIHRSRFVCKKWLGFDDERKRRATLLAVMKVRRSTGSNIASWRSFFFYNLVHNEIVELPSLQWNNIRGNISDRIIIEFQMTMQKAVFSSSPTSPDCVIFILWNTVTVNDDLERSKNFTITTYTHKDRRWSIYENPCFNGGVFEGAA